MVSIVIKSLFNSRLHHISFSARPCGLEIIDTTVHLFRLRSSANNIQSNTTQFTLDWRADDCNSKLLSSSPQYDIIAFSFMPPHDLSGRVLAQSRRSETEAMQGFFEECCLLFQFWFHGCASKCVIVWCIIHEGAE